MIQNLLSCPNCGSEHLQATFGLDNTFSRDVPVPILAVSCCDCQWTQPLSVETKTSRPVDAPAPVDLPISPAPSF